MYRMVEQEQNPEAVAFWADAFAADGEYVADPIVVVDCDWILDGHHRAIAADAAGLAPTVSPITAAQLARLTALGLDGIDAAAVAHLLAGNDQAATNLDLQFAGAGILDRAYDAIDTLAVA